MGSPIVHLGSPLLKSVAKGPNLRMPCKSPFQAHAHGRTKVLQSFTQAPYGRGRITLPKWVLAVFPQQTRGS